MPLLNTSIPNLTQGVSQQPSNIRHAGQAESQTNALSSVVEGLVKRPNSRLIQKLNDSTNNLNAIDNQSFVGLIDRGSESERFVVVIPPSSDTVEMWKVDGTDITVTSTLSGSYLNDSNPKDAIKMLTVADTTWLLNRNKSVPALTGNSGAVANKALIFIKQAAKDVKYTVKLNGATFEAEITSGTEIKSSEILSVLKSGSSLSHLTYSGTAGGLDGVAGLTTTLDGNVLQISQSSVFVGLSVTDEISDTGIGLAYNEVANITDLPAKAFNDFKIKIKGNVELSEDDYYVNFTATNGTSGEGTWIEAIAPNVATTINKAFMPVSLVPTGSATYDLKEITWTDRAVGDNDSNPAPSFVGNTINDIFFFKNRLGLLTKDNVVLSEAGEYYNFFRNTVINLLDSALIDVAVAHQEVNDLHHAVPFQEKLLLMSPTSQFTLRGNDLLTPKTVNISPVTSFTANQYPAPLSLGGFVYFAFSRGNSQGIREFAVDDLSSTYHANEITEHVPKYIPDRIDRIIGSSSENVLICTTSASPYILYVYKYFWQNKDKLQSSWSKFTFRHEVIGGNFIDSNLYVILTDTTNTYLEKIPFESGVADTTYNILLDDRITSSALTVSYDANTLKTTISNIPYDPVNAVVYTQSGTRYVLTRVDASSATVNVDLSSTTFYLGHEYEMEYEFSDQLIKQPSERGGRSVSNFTKQVIRNMSIEYSDTGSFNVEVTPEYRDTYTYEYSPVQLGADFNIGSLTPESGTFRVPVHSEPDKVTIKIKSLSALPVKILSAEVESFISSRSKRYA
tara:strand:- start:13207 stop:15582 length:2376 start_codon:yes stop_codon:yes gene_type:complete